MKQHITIEQALSLTDKQAVSLYNHLYRTNYTIDDLDGRGKAGGNFKDMECWYTSAFAINTTVGKMIEIIFQKNKYISIEIMDTYNSVEASKDFYENDKIVKDLDESELVDVLFEMLKEAL